MSFAGFEGLRVLVAWDAEVGYEPSSASYDIYISMTADDQSEHLQYSDTLHVRVTPGLTRIKGETRMGAVLGAYPETGMRHRLEYRDGCAGGDHSHAGSRSGIRRSDHGR